MSILVLPFANRSPDPDQEFLSDGLTEEIITDLSKIRALRVISRNSAMLLKGTAKNTSTLAREVGVSHVLSGSVRRSGDALRIMAELVDGATDNPIWSDKFSGTVADVFDMQERVARAIVEALSLELRPTEWRRLRERPFGNVRAYECYLRARQEMWRFTPDGLRRSVKLLEEGLGIVGDNAFLYAALGHAYFQHLNAMIRTDEEPLRKAEACVEKCFALVPGMPQAYVVRGMIAWFRGDWRAAFRDVREALRRERQDPDALIWASVLCTYSGQLKAAKEVVDQLLSIDPLTSVGSVGLGLILWMEGRFEDALVPMSKAYELDPTIMVTSFYAQTLRHAGRTEEAEKLLRGAPAIGFQEWMVAITLAGWEGRGPDVLALGTHQYAESARNLGIWSLWVAESHALVGAEQEALEWLTNAVHRGLIYPSFLATYNRSLADLRGRPRFEALMARAQREWEEFSLEAASSPELPWTLGPAPDSGGGAPGNRLRQGRSEC